MSEKRYKQEYVNCEVSEIIDTVENESLTAEEITDRLNKLHEENVELKEAMKRLMADMMIWDRNE